MSNPNCFSDRPGCDVLVAHTHEIADALPGHVVVCSLEDIDPSCGHVEVVPPRRSFLARLADSVRGRK